MSSDGTEVWDRGATGDGDDDGDRDRDGPVPRDPREWGPRRFAGVGVAVVSAGVLLFGSPAVDRIAANGGDLLVLGAGYAFHVATAGWVVRAAAWAAGVAPKSRIARAGRAIGGVESVLALTLTLLGAYVAVAIVFAAGAVVRSRDAWSGDTPYHLLASLAIASYSLVYGLLLAGLLGGPGL